MKNDTVIGPGIVTRQAIGQVFGKLRVVAFAGYKRIAHNARTPMMVCKCACGKTTRVSLWDLRAGKTRSCNINHRRYDDRSIPAFNAVYHMYQIRALKAFGRFPITKEQFRFLTQQRCHYCGAIPLAVSHRGRRGVCRTGKHISQYVYNGLDRKNNSKGYTRRNVVPCCYICNHAKNTMTYREFLVWLDRIVAFKKEQEQ